jgi:hypothetical protein
MDKIKPAMITKIRTYLKKIEIPYLRVHNDNILLLRSAGSHHYLLVQFYSMPENWFSERRHFDIKIARPSDYNKAIESIDKYLKGL